MSHSKNPPAGRISPLITEVLPKNHEDLPASSRACCLVRPISARRWSLSSRRCVRWCLRSHDTAILASPASRTCQNRLRSGNDGWMYLAEVQFALAQDMSHLHKWSETTLGHESSSGGCR